MKLLTITKQTQGTRKNDFCWADEGEIAVFGTQCSRGRVDDACGCRRSMSGITSDKAGTTMMIRDVDITVDGLSELLMAKFEYLGLSKNKLTALISSEVEQLISMGDLGEVGAIAERRGNVIGFRAAQEVAA